MPRTCGRVLVRLGGEVVRSIALVLLLMVVLTRILLVLSNRLDKSATCHWIYIDFSAHILTVHFPIES